MNTNLDAVLADFDTTPPDLVYRTDNEPLAQADYYCYEEAMMNEDQISRMWNEDVIPLLGELAERLPFETVLEITARGGQAVECRVMFYYDPTMRDLENALSVLRLLHGKRAEARITHEQGRVWMKVARKA